MENNPYEALILRARLAQFHQAFTLGEKLARIQELCDLLVQCANALEAQSDVIDQRERLLASLERMTRSVIGPPVPPYDANNGKIGVL